MKKRRNNGRNKIGKRGRTVPKRCDNCRAMVPKDKIIPQFKVKSLIEDAAKDDVFNACVDGSFDVPSISYKFLFCVSCAVHRRIVRARPKWRRKERYGYGKFRARVSN